MSSQVDRPKVRRMGKTDVMAHFVEHFTARGLTLGRADAREFLEELRLCVQQLNDTGEFTLLRSGADPLKAGAAQVAAYLAERAETHPADPGVLDVLAQRRPSCGRRRCSERGPVGSPERPVADASCGAGDDQAPCGGGGSFRRRRAATRSGRRASRRICRTEVRSSTRNRLPAMRRRGRRSCTTGRRTRSRSTRSNAS